MLLALALSLAPLQSPADAHWNQSQAHPTGSGWVDVAAPREAPLELWSATFDVLETAPVVWDGIVFVVGERERARLLVAIDARTGEELDAERIGSLPALELVASEGQVALVSPDKLSLYSLREGALRRQRSKRIEVSSPVCLDDGFLFFLSGSELRALEFASLRNSGDPLPTPVVGEGRASRPVFNASRHQIAFVHVGELHIQHEELDLRYGNGVHLIYANCSQNGRDRALGNRWQFHGPALEPSQVELPPVQLHWLQGQTQHEDVWMAGVHAPIETRDSGAMQWVRIESSLRIRGLPLVGNAVLLEGGLLAWNHEEELLWLDSQARSLSFLPEGARPARGRTGALSLARDVLLLGNWAVDTATREVLWCLPTVDPLGPLLPAADGLLVYRDERHVLHGLGAPGEED